MQSYVTGSGLALVTLPIGLAIGFVFAARLLRRKPPPGWGALKPSVTLLFSSLGSAAFAGLIVWVWAFVGSARHDAGFQMNVAWWLALAFGLGACLAGYQSFMIAKRPVFWRGKQLMTGEGRSFSFDDIQTVEHSLFRRTCLTLHDGTRIRIDPQATGADGLMQRIYEAKGMTEYLDAPEH